MIFLNTFRIESYDGFDLSIFSSSFLYSCNTCVHEISLNFPKNLVKNLFWLKWRSILYISCCTPCVKKSYHPTTNFHGLFLTLSSLLELALGQDEIITPRWNWLVMKHHHVINIWHEMLSNVSDPMDPMTGIRIYIYIYM